MLNERNDKKNNFEGVECFAHGSQVDTAKKNMIKTENNWVSTNQNKKICWMKTANIIQKFYRFESNEINNLINHTKADEHTS